VNSEALIVWSTCEFAAELKIEFGAESVITSERELSTAKFDKYSGIVLLVELAWDGKNKSAFYGIDLARAVLRAKLKLNLPILFVSFLSPKQIRLDDHGNEILDRQIVGAVGHDFLRLPSAPQQWFDSLRAMEALTDLQFFDILNNFCDVKGLIAERIHQLKNQCRVLFDNQEAKDHVKDQVIKVFDEIAGLIGEKSEAATKRKSLISRLDLEPLSESTIDSFLTSSEAEFKAVIADDALRETVSTFPRSKREPWKALILDDEPEGLRPLLAALELRGVQFAVARSVVEAEHELEKDRISNELTVAIVDYRLLKMFEGVTWHQRQQGYDFLLTLAKEDRFTALVALSGLSRRFLLESFRKYNTRVEIYSKNDLNGEGAVNLFADNILDLGREQFEAMCSQPSAAEWQVLKPFYIAHRQSADYVLREKSISDDARRVALQIQALFQRLDVEDLITPQLPKFENLQKRMTSDNSAEFEELMPIFRNKLVARRLAIWLHLALDFGAVSILLALNGELVPDRMLEEIREDLREKGEKKGPKWVEFLDVNAQKELKNRAKQPLTALGLSLSDLPSHILVEERAWLAFSMGLDVSDYQASSEETFHWIQVGAEEWCERNPTYAKRLAETVDFVDKDGRPAISSWADAKSFLLATRNLLSTQQEKRDFEVLIASIGEEISSKSKAPGLIKEFKELAVQLSRASAPRGPSRSQS